ncbi:sensor histidine kinase [Ottowia thiooxydans]|uniref:sensor histidine kinase n=1 Tax=Ottowia thiooxydans TaxID=219182 RepID=UPI0003FC6B0D|nr:ATP-binding protein [Ottowia thiooxydans]
MKPIARRLSWLLLWLACSVAGMAWLTMSRLAELRADFDTDARIAHRVLSQRMAQHDAILATLALLQPVNGSGEAERLSALYPQIIDVMQRPVQGVWPAGSAAALAAAEATSRREKRAVLADEDLTQGRYWLVLAAHPLSYVLRLDLRAAVPWVEWPMDAAASTVRATLVHGGRSFVIQQGRLDDDASPRWRWAAVKTLASASQPLELVLERPLAMRELPLAAMIGWVVVSALLLAALRMLWQQRVARRRAEELLHLGQVARLNTLGELAAGMAHELNQPLTALLANTQAARRLLDEQPVDVGTAREAMAQAANQARRAADVVGRLRRLVERPELATQVQPVALGAAVQEALHLLEPELQRRGIEAEVFAEPDLPAVQAEPVALQQIIHNLLMNAVQSMESVPPARRKLRLRWQRKGTHALLSVRDQGDGILPEARGRVFEPFYTTRDGGLGLGLSLSHSLAEAMGGSLVLAEKQEDFGAEFHLLLPLV